MRGAVREMEPRRAASSQRDAPGRDDDAPAVERARLVDVLGRAARAGDKAAAIDAADALAAHRRAYVLHPVVAIGLDLAAAGFLVDAGLALRGARLVRGDGADAPGEAPGIAAVVLAARDRISDAERAYVVAEALRVCDVAGVSCQGFARAAALPAGPAPPPPATAAGSPALLGVDRAVVVVDSDHVVAFPFDAAAAAREVEAQLASRMAPAAAPRVAFALSAAPSPLQTLVVHVDAAGFGPARARADARFVVKSALVGAVGALAAAVAALAVLYQRRRARYVELKGSLVAAVSHELKTPLASMRLLVESLERRIVGDARATEYLGRLLKDVDGLTSLVEDLLGVHRLEKGKATLRKERVPLGALLDDVAAEARERAPRELDVEIEGAANVDLQADPDLLRMAVKNLVVNALQHNERTPISIKLRVVDGPVVAIRVKDNGVGVPSGEETRIFEEFHRARREGRASRGSGLGLTLVARAAAAHGGRARVVETGPSGSTFEITVPKGRPL